MLLTNSFLWGDCWTFVWHMLRILEWITTKQKWSKLTFFNWSIQKLKKVPADNQWITSTLLRLCFPTVCDFSTVKASSLYMCALWGRTNKKVIYLITGNEKTPQKRPKCFSAKQLAGSKRSCANHWLVYFLKLWLRLKILSSVLGRCLQTTNKATDLSRQQCSSPAAGLIIDAHHQTVSQACK